VQADFFEGRHDDQFVSLRRLSAVAILISNPMRQRLAYIIATACIVLAGLLVRRAGIGLPRELSKYGGSILWGAMVYFIVAFFIPSASLAKKTATAALIAVFVESIRLYHLPWLDEFRTTAAGHLLLGRYFSLLNILAYWTGIALSTYADKMAQRPAADRHGSLQ
jgi:hypothetical protein